MNHELKTLTREEVEKSLPLTGSGDQIDIARERVLALLDERDTQAEALKLAAADNERLRAELTEAKADRVVLEARWEKASAEAERAKTERARLVAVLKTLRIDLVFGTTQNAAWERFLHEQRESMDAALSSSSDAWLAAHDAKVRADERAKIDAEYLEKDVSAGLRRLAASPKTGGER
jgi:hypothetical protein